MKLIHERFLEKVQIVEECWEWMSVVNDSGYGEFSMDGRMKKAHRASYELFNGSIPDGLLVRHKCDTRTCVNPWHLILGTAKDNSQDTLSRGRNPNASKSFCIRGHSLKDPKNLVPRKGKVKVRVCRTCARLRGRAFMKAKRDRINASKA